MPEPTDVDKKRFHEKSLDAIRAGNRKLAIQLEAQNCIDAYYERYGCDAGYASYCKRMREEADAEIASLSWCLII